MVDGKVDFVAALERKRRVWIVVDGQARWTTDHQPRLRNERAQVRLEASDLGRTAQAAEGQHGHRMGLDLEQVDA